MIPGIGYGRACKLCGEQVWFVQATPAVQRAGGKTWHCLDPEPVDRGGNIMIDGYGRAHVVETDDPRYPGELHLDHHVTCEVWRERRAQEAQTRLDVDE